MPILGRVSSSPQEAPAHNVYPLVPTLPHEQAREFGGAVRVVTKTTGAMKSETVSELVEFAAK